MERAPQRNSGLGVALLSGKILRCGTCGHSLTRDVSKQGEHYRCKNQLCTARASVQSKAIETYVFLNALAWHATLNPMYQLDAELMGPYGVEEELARTQAELAEVEEAYERGELSPVAYGKALTAAQYALAAAETVLSEAEASRGWLGMSTDAVQRRLLGEGNVCKDVEAGRDFIRQMVKVTVKPVGRGRKVAVQDRVEIEQLTPQAVLRVAFVQIEAVEVADVTGGSLTQTQRLWNMLTEAIEQADATEVIGLLKGGADARGRPSGRDMVGAGSRVRAAEGWHRRLKGRLLPRAACGPSGPLSLVGRWYGRSRQRGR